MEQDETNVEKTWTDPITGKFVKGNPGGGRPVGTRDFNTIYKAALEKLAKENNKTPDELEDEMLAMGVVMSRKGQFQFYKDTLDRRYGKAKENIEISGELTSKIVRLDVE